MTVVPFESALVTGASSGIGAAIADELGRAGVRTIVVARRRERLEELAERHAGFELVVADLTTGAGQQAVVKRISSVANPNWLVVFEWVSTYTAVPDGLPCKILSRKPTD